MISIDTFGDEYVSILNESVRRKTDSAHVRYLRDDRAGRHDSDMVEGRLRTTEDEPVAGSVFRGRQDEPSIPAEELRQYDRQNDL